MLIVRHADPDYAADSLTEKGWREAKHLAGRLSSLHAVHYYVSPLGRAKDTASLTLKRAEKVALELPWLEEFQAPILRPDMGGRPACPWNWLPQDWTCEPRFFLPDHWWEPELMALGQVKERYDWVTAGLDELLNKHGYHREGFLYQAQQPNSDTLVLFCHFGVGCVLLSHLLYVSPMVLWQGLSAAPSSVTTLYTEERREGTAIFRMSSYGDISHLYAHAEPPSPAGCFREYIGSPVGADF